MRIKSPRFSKVPPKQKRKSAGFKFRCARWEMDAFRAVQEASGIPSFYHFIDWALRCYRSKMEREIGIKDSDLVEIDRSTRLAMGQRRHPGIRRSRTS